MRIAASEVIKQEGLQVALGGAWKDSDDDFAAILLFVRLLQGSPGDRAAADADREPFFLHDADGGGYGVSVADSDDPIDEIDAQGVGQ